ncbi:MAG: peptidoglycan DD-metalloendopeptidase family protein [Candidatus Cloacimonetes bacterium]|nr:peptidoglycan DD-metalloendopeptidase family protein [Candidatus Cloacimonadota bacterium]
MNKTLIFLLLLLIAVLLVNQLFIASENRKLKEKVKDQQQELDVSTKYIQHLTEQLNKIQNAEKVSTSSPDKLRELLNSYLKEQKDEEYSQKIRVPIEELQEDLSEYEKKRRFIPDLIPVKGDYAISQRYSEKHKATDFAAPTGTEVIASAAGEVLSVYQDKYFGNVMIVDHLNEYATFYAHLATTIFEAKTFVEKGETIALVGSTGNSTAPHLHFEVLVNGENIDPETILK